MPKYNLNCFCKYYHLSSATSKYSTKQLKEFLLKTKKNKPVVNLPSDLLDFEVLSQKLMNYDIKLWGAVITPEG